jgi:hypothetical protein
MNLRILAAIGYDFLQRQQLEGVSWDKCVKHEMKCDGILIEPAKVIIMA